MLTSVATAALVALIGGLSACGAERPPELSTVHAQGDALLAVKNDHYLDVTLYAVRGGARHRLGTVTGLKTDTIPLRNTIVGGAGTVRIVVEPIGSARAHVTESISVGPDQVIELTIRNPLNLTSFIVAHR